MRTIRGGRTSRLTGLGVLRQPHMQSPYSVFRAENRTDGSMIPYPS